LTRKLKLKNFNRMKIAREYFCQATALAALFMLGVRCQSDGDVPRKRVDGTPRLLQKYPAEYSMSPSNCTFMDFAATDQIACVQKYETPVDALISSELLRGDCTDMSTGPHDKFFYTTEKISPTEVVTLIKFQGLDEGVTSVCLLTRVATSDYIEMFYVKTPIDIYVKYDGSVTVIANITEAEISDKAEEVIVFTAEAFVCNPNFSPYEGTFTITSILYVCIQPNVNQMTAVIKDVNFFFLNLAGDSTWGFFAVSPGGITSSVSIVVDKNTRRLIVATRLPPQFYETDAVIIGRGEVFISHQDRKLRTGRGLQEEAKDVFQFLLRTEEKPPLGSASACPVADLATVVALAVPMLAAFYCLE